MNAEIEKILLKNSGQMSYEEYEYIHDLMTKNSSPLWGERWFKHLVKIINKV